MRQSKREITAEHELRAILDSCDSCRLALSDHGQPYIIPLNYGYAWQTEDTLELYFHCANEGRKLDILRHNSKACVELDHRHELVTGDEACQFTMNYESMILFGQVEIVTDPAQRLAGLNCIMRHYSSRSNWTFDEKVLAMTTVLRFSADAWTGKRLQK